MKCIDHDEIAVGACPTCGHEVCELCLQPARSLGDFECPECGEFGVVIYDGEPGESPAGENEPGESWPWKS